MFNVSSVSEYSGLSTDKIFTIMKNYSDLKKEYGKRRKKQKE